MSRAAALLVQAARLELGPAERERFLALAAALSQSDWAALPAAAESLRVSGLLHKHLGEYDPPGAAPRSARDALAPIRRRESLRGLKKYAQLARLADATAAEGIDLILLKGAYLARWVYRDLSLRPFNDFDLLARQSDAPALTALVGRLGFKPKPAVAHSRVHARLLPAMAHHLPALHKADWPGLEIHAWPNDEFLDRGYPMEDVWRRAVPLDWDGRRIFALSPEDQVVSLSLHLARHLESGLVKLYWPSDVREVVRRAAGGLNWAAVSRTLQALDAAATVAPLWRTLRVEWGVPFPDGLEGKAPAIGASVTPAAAILDLIGRGTPGPPARSLRRSYLRILKAGLRSSTLPDRLLFAWKQAFPDRAYIRYRYDIPEGQPLFFHYVRHLRRGLRPFLGRRTDRS